MRNATILAMVLAWGGALFGNCDARAELVTLRDGRPLMGDVVSATESGLEMRLFEGGELSVPWDRVIERDAERLQKRFGLIAEVEAEVMIDGVRLVLEDGKIFEGALLEAKRPDAVNLKLADGPREFPRTRIVSIEEVEIAARDAYTPRQLYRLKIEEAGEPQTPGAHFELANYCQRIGDYDKALEHLETLETDFAEYKAEGVRLQKQSVLVIRSQQEAISLFDEIRSSAHRKQYERALTALASLEFDFPESPMLAKVERYGLTRERLEEARRGLDRERVTSRYFYWMREVATRKAREAELTLSEVKSFAQREMADAIAEQVAASEQFTPEDVKELWGERTTFLKRRAGYGNGTYLVEKPKKKPKPQRPQNRGRNQRGRGNQGRQQPTIERKPLTADEWWTQARPNQRRDWMLAYYAENSSDVEVKRIDYKQCVKCGGAGSLNVLNTGGGAQAIVCDRCWVLGSDRAVVFH